MNLELMSVELYSKKQVQHLTGITNSEWIDVFRDDSAGTARVPSGTGEHRLLTLKEVCAIGAAVFLKRYLRVNATRAAKEILGLGPYNSAIRPDDEDIWSTRGFE